MSSKIKNFYIRLFQMAAALYFGALLGLTAERVLKAAHLNASFQIKDLWSYIVDIPAMLLTALFAHCAWPEKIVWILLYCLGGAYALRSNSKKWFLAIIGIAACLWVFYEASAGSL